MSKKNIQTCRIKISILGLLSNLRINLIGQIPLSEIFILPFSFTPSYWKTIWKSSDMRRIISAFSFLWLAQVISDIVNHSSTTNAARGWANLLMAIVVIVFIAKQLSTDRSIIIYYLAGQAISLTLFEPFMGGISPEESMGYFKFYIAPILNNIILILAYYLLKKSTYNQLYVVITFIFYGLICLFLDSRSNGTFMILTGMILYFKKNIPRITGLKTLLSSVIIITILQSAYMVYVSQVLSGKFGGEHAKTQLVRLKNPYNPFSLIETGRTEVFVAMYAIKDKPFFGHGSWAPDPDGKYNAIAYEMQGEKERFGDIYNNSGEMIIPSHSVIFGTWMSAGILGFLCICYVFLFFIRKGITLIKSPIVMNTPLAPIIIFFFINGVWTFLFSPLPSIRQQISLSLAFIIIMNAKLATLKSVHNRNMRIK